MIGILGVVQAIAYHQTRLNWLMWVALALCVKAFTTKAQRLLNISSGIAILIIIFCL